MALRAILADFAALGNEDGSFIDESLIDVLLGALASTQVSSLLDLSLLFDHDGDELRTEVGEFVASNGCLEAEFLLFQVVLYLKAARPEDLEDTPVIPGTGRRLPKRKLMYGRMVIDFEAEYVAKRPRLQLPLPSVPVSSSRIASTRNIQKAESLASAFSGPLSTSVRVAPKAGTISLLDKESKIRDRAADACFDLLRRVGASSSRYVVLFGRECPPSQELLDVQRDLFMGSRASNSVLCMVKDMHMFLDWIHALELPSLVSNGSVESFYTAAYLKSQRKRGRSVPNRTLSAIVWAEDSLKLDFGAKEKDVRTMVTSLCVHQGSKSVPATCMPAEITVKFEHMAAGMAETSGPIQCFAGCSLLCAYGVKRWSDAQHIFGKSIAVSDDAITMDTYKSKRKKQLMSWTCPRRSISNLEWVHPWLKVMGKFDLPGEDYLIRRVSTDLMSFTFQPAEWNDMNRLLHAVLISHCGLDSRSACTFTMHSFRHLLPTCAFQLGVPEPEVEAMGQWGNKASTARLYDSVALASELSTKTWIISNLSAGWRPVRAGSIPSPPQVLRMAALPSAPPSHVLPPADWAKRGEICMRQLNAEFKLRPSVRQVVGTSALVHLYCVFGSRSMTLCKRWTCGPFENPVKGAVFSADPNFFDNDKYGFCERCYSKAVFERFAEVRHSSCLQPPSSSEGLAVSSKTASACMSSDSSYSSDSE